MGEKKGLRGIIAINKRQFIGLNGKLPWSSKEDLIHFKNLTMNSTLLVGYNTSKTLPDLPGRTIIIDKENEIIDCSSIDWCSGGKTTYEKYCHLFDELHISNIDDDTIGDTSAPILTNINPNCKVFNYFFKKD